MENRVAERTMTVRDLIDALRNLPQDYEIYVGNPEAKVLSVENVKFDEEEPHIEIITDW